MLQLHNILVARDAAPGSERALQVAFDLARHTGASVHTLYAAVPREHYFRQDSLPALDAAEARAEAIYAANGAVEAAAGEHVHVKRVVIRDIATGPAILDYAAAHDVDLIVVVTHGRRGLPRWLFGSIAEEVVRGASCPVLAVPISQKAAPGDRPSILVPIDFSEHAREALRHAKALGALLGARLDLLHVVEETLHPAFYGPKVFSIYDVRPDIEEQAVEQMKHLYQTTEGPGGEVHFEALPGKAARAIAAYADERGTDLIVMATHGLTGLERFFIGSVAEKVVRHAPSPVLTVKSFGKSLVREPEVAIPDETAIDVQRHTSKAPEPEVAVLDETPSPSRVIPSLRIRPVVVNSEWV